MYLKLIKDYFWFYKESLNYMSHQSKLKTFLQAIPKSFIFIKWQHNHYKRICL